MKINNVKTLTFSVLLFASIAFAETKSIHKELYEATLFQDPVKMKQLIAKGANANYRETGRPLLGWAAQSNNAEIVQVLIDAKADVDSKDEGIGHTPLMRAVETGHLPTVEILLNAKANPNVMEPDGESVLMMAVKNDNPEIVSALIIAGADVNYKTKDNDTAPLIAAQTNLDKSAEIIKILGEAKADLNVSNLVYTPLSYAVEVGNKDLVKALLDAGADPNAKTEGGKAPIFLALDKPEIIELLVSKKADPNITDSSGGSALIGAIQNGSTEAALALIRAGADINKPDDYGNTPIQVATSHSMTAIIEVLKKSGALQSN